MACVNLLLSRGRGTVELKCCRIMSRKCVYSSRADPPVHAPKCVLLGEFASWGKCPVFCDPVR